MAGAPRQEPQMADSGPDSRAESRFPAGSRCAASAAGTAAEASRPAAPAVAWAGAEWAFRPGALAVRTVAADSAARRAVPASPAAEARASRPAPARAARAAVEDFLVAARRSAAQPLSAGECCRPSSCLRAQSARTPLRRGTRLGRGKRSVSVSWRSPRKRGSHAPRRHGISGSRSVVSARAERDVRRPATSLAPDSRASADFSGDPRPAATAPRSRDPRPPAWHARRPRRRSRAWRWRARCRRVPDRCGW